MTACISGIKKKWYKQIYLQNRERLTNLENELMSAGHTAIFKMGSQQGHTVQPWGLWSVLYDSLDGRGEMDAWMHERTCQCRRQKRCGFDPR